MSPHQTREAELKLEAYRAATAASAVGQSYSPLNQSSRGPTVGEIKAEAERLWKWMSTEEKES